ncbi:MAG: glycogen synthase [Chthonomonadaceae bacterium]|uniref:Glycogen synthase n=1 Tax=Candidatus Nitrosymbiomonas proteolyticus TaxID=2608984 RepID=A0A809RBP2_9BACT|nr:glycogen synthase [Candidatus Nitrosymbiomonas proteolyticus]
MKGISLKVLFVSAEVAPFAKVGGLADVIGSLPKALAEMGHEVRVIMPAYGMIEEQHALEVVPVNGTFEVGTGSLWNRRAYLKRTQFGKVEIWFVGGHERFAAARSSETVYQSGFEQYVFFAKAVLEACAGQDWIPDIVHANDWHTGLVPVLMEEDGSRVWERTARAFTIHNLAYQGIFGIDVLDYAGLDHSLFRFDKLETFGAFNFLKAGCVYSDQVNTVSERYSREIETPEFGCGLWGLMRHLRATGRFQGILNGIDTDEFNPATDPRIAANFDAHHPAGKSICRSDLMREIQLEPIESTPLLVAVSRLSEQKGMDLILSALERLVALPTQIFIQGIGDPWLADRFDEAAQKYPKHFRFVERFDIELGQRAYAGGDMFLMPSSFEPCGLGQMIAMRYGTAPIVRSTGGLADTVIDGELGFVFGDRTPEGLFDAVTRARDSYLDPSKWYALQQACLRADYSWESSAVRYQQMYESAVRHRRGTAPSEGSPAAGNFVG